MGTTGCSLDSDNPVFPSYEGDEVLSESVTITSQDQFEILAGVKRVYGYIYIRGTQVHDLSPLSDLEYCESLMIQDTAVISLEGLENLEIVQRDLRIAYNHTLRDLDALASLERVFTMVLQGNQLVQDLAVFRHTNVTDLQIADMPEISSLATLDAMEGLSTLAIIRCEQLTQLPPQPVLSSLTRLTLGVLPALAQLADSPIDFPLLTDLSLSDLPLIEDLTGLGEMSSLHSFGLWQMSSLSDLSGPSNLDNLATLSLMGPMAISDFSGLPSLPALYRLRISDCRNLNSLGGFPDLPQLSDLELNRLSLTGLGGLPALPSLTHLSISQFGSLHDLSGFPVMPRLERLSIGACYALNNLGGLVDSTVPWQLEIVNCLFASIGTEYDLPNCKTLILSSCNQLYSIDGIEVLTGLTGLDVRGCTMLRDFEGLQCLETMEFINLSFNPSLASLNGLQGVHHLTDDLSITDNAQLHNLSGLGNLETVPDIRITDNPSLPQEAVISFVGGLDSWNTAVIRDNGS